MIVGFLTATVLLAMGSLPALGQRKIIFDARLVGGVEVAPKPETGEYEKLEEIEKYLTNTTIDFRRDQADTIINANQDSVELQLQIKVAIYIAPALEAAIDDFCLRLKTPDLESPLHLQLNAEIENKHSGKRLLQNFHASVIFVNHPGKDLNLREYFAPGKATLKVIRTSDRCQRDSGRMATITVGSTQAVTAPPITTVTPRPKDDFVDRTEIAFRASYGLYFLPVFDVTAYAALWEHRVFSKGEAWKLIGVSGLGALEIVLKKKVKFFRERGGETNIAFTVLNLGLLLADLSDGELDVFGAIEARKTPEIGLPPDLPPRTTAKLPFQVNLSF